MKPLINSLQMVAGGRWNVALAARGLLGVGVRAAGLAAGSVAMEVKCLL